MDHQIQVDTHGIASFRDIRVGETMHSSIGPWQEAHLIYIEQSKLAARLNSSDPDPLVLFDVGLGIAANALAAVNTFNLVRPRRSLHMVSFENDISGLKTALEHSATFTFLQGKENLLRSLIHNGSVTQSNPNGTHLQWGLLQGDFRKAITNAPSPEVVFFDFYSPKSSPELWNKNCFELLYRSTLDRRNKNKGATLVTYSGATSARTALLLAGFFVGYGKSTPVKKETTIASTSYSDLERPLNGEWINHWKRSSKPMPNDCAPIELEYFLSQTAQYSKLNDKLSTH